MIPLLIGIFIITVLSYVYTKKIIHPLVLFNGIFFITLSLYQLELSTLQSDLSKRTVLIFYLCIVSFNLFYIIFSFIKARYALKLKSQSRRLSFQKRLNIARFLVVFIFIIEVLYSGGFPLTWRLLGNSKNYFDYGISSLHGAWNGLVICLGAYSLFKKTKEKWIYIGLGILIISRQVIISIIIEGIVFALCTKRAGALIDRNIIDKKKIIIIAVIAVAGFTILGNFRSGNDVMNIVFKPKEQYAKLPDAIKWIYSYMVFSVANFNNLVGITNGFVNYGASTLGELLPTFISKAINLRLNESPYYLVSPNYTVATYLPGIYLDFGLSGVLLLNIAIALIGNVLYSGLLKKKTDKSALMYAVFVHNILLLFFSNMFSNLSIVIQFLYIPLIFIDDNVDKEQEAEQGR